MRYARNYAIAASLAIGAVIGCVKAYDEQDPINMNEKEERGESTGSPPSVKFDLPVSPLETIEWVEENVSETAAEMVADKVEEKADSVHIDPEQGEVVKAQVNLYRGKKKSRKIQAEADEIGLATQELMEEISERKERKKRCN